MLITNNGAVCDLPKSFQLDNANNESQDMCGPWSVAELHYAGLPGHGPRGTAQNVDDWAEAEYTKYIGPNVISNQNGSSIPNMHQFLTDAVDDKDHHRLLHYYDITAILPGSSSASDLAHLYRALDAGYPVLVTVNEQSVKRPDGSNPYPWQPAMGPANHIFTLVGHRVENGVACLLVDDELNQSDNWPDLYRADSLEVHWASVVQLIGPDANNPWLKAIPSDDPTSWPAGFVAQNFLQGGNMVPVNWHDDGTTLTAPNGHKVVHGFRAWVLSHTWDGANEPLEEEQGMAQLEASNPSLGGGTQQAFHTKLLGWTQARGVFEEWGIDELLYTRKQYAGLYAQHQQDTAEIVALKAQVAALQAGQAPVPDQVKTAAQYVMRYLGI